MIHEPHFPDKLKSVQMSHSSRGSINDDNTHWAMIPQFYQSLWITVRVERRKRIVITVFVDSLLMQKK